MEYLQYMFGKIVKGAALFVLNLIINGIPSILKILGGIRYENTVLNLIINGIPSIPYFPFWRKKHIVVLNLIINGIPSILIW